MLNYWTLGRSHFDPGTIIWINFKEVFCHMQNILALSPMDLDKFLWVFVLYGTPTRFPWDIEFFEKYLKGSPQDHSWEVWSHWVVLEILLELFTHNKRSMMHNTWWWTTSGHKSKNLVTAISPNQYQYNQVHYMFQKYNAMSK